MSKREPTLKQASAIARKRDNDCMSHDVATIEDLANDLLVANEHGDWQEQARIACVLIDTSKDIIARVLDSKRA